MTISLRAALLASAAFSLLACADTDRAARTAADEAAPKEQTAMTADREARADQADPYLWLEEVEGEEALSWVRAENERSLAELEATPAYADMLAEARAILTSEERIPAAALRGGYAYNFWQDQTSVRGQWRRMPASAYVDGSDDWDVILDVDALAEAEGANWVYKGTDCLAPDYTRCMITLSPGGSDAAVRREFDVATRSFVENGYTLEEAKASTAWMGEDMMLVGTSTDGATDSGYPVRTRMWARGTDMTEAPVIFEGEASDVGVWPFSIYDRESGAHVGGIVRAVTFYDSEHHLVGEDGQTTKLPFPSKVDLAGYKDGEIIVSLNEPWDYEGQAFPLGSVVAFDPQTRAASLVFEPTETQAVQGVSSGPGAIYVSLLDDINGRILKLTKGEGEGEGGWDAEPIGLPQKGIASLASLDDETGQMLLYHEDPTRPETLYFAENGEGLREIDRSPAFFDTQGVVVRQFKAVSKDGTEVPYTVIAREGVLDAGPAPTIQYGYGGFQVPILPGYSGTQGKLWVERGGVYVIANIRGGGEYGPAWHQAGLKGERQRIYDDFFAVSEDMIERGITTPDQLGILGGSNGGLLMGVSMVQRPDLYKAVGIGVPLLDMLRYHKLLAGASWVDEYGDPDNPDDWDYIKEYSPYQNLSPEADYPPVLFTTSTRDDRVHPAHARKMVAKMEAQGHDEVYYYENTEGGHAGGANNEQRAYMDALAYTFLLEELR